MIIAHKIKKYMCVSNSPLEHIMTTLALRSFKLLLWSLYKPFQDNLKFSAKSILAHCCWAQITLQHKFTQFFATVSSKQLLMIPKLKNLSFTQVSNDTIINL